MGRRLSFSPPARFLALLQVGCSLPKHEEEILHAPNVHFLGDIDTRTGKGSRGSFHRGEARLWRLPKFEAEDLQRQDEFSTGASDNI